MKKLMTMMLGVALVTGTATYSLAQDKDKAPKAAKKGGGTCADKSKVGKDGKCKDGSDPVKGGAKSDKKKK